MATTHQRKDDNNTSKKRALKMEETHLVMIQRGRDGRNASKKKVTEKKDLSSDDPERPR